MFTLHTDDGSERCWRIIGWSMNPGAMRFRLRSNSVKRVSQKISVMVWGWIIINGFGNLVVVDGNLNSILTLTS